MTVRDTESFTFSYNSTDYVNYGRFIGNLSNPAVEGWGVNTGGPFGDNYCTMGYTNGVQVIRRILPGGPFTTLYLSMRMYIPTGNGLSHGPFDVVNSAQQCGFYFNGNNGAISAFNSSGTFFTSGPGVFPVNTWFWCSMKFVCGTGTSGAMGVQVNGTQVVNLTGVATQSTGRAEYDTTYWYNSTPSAYADIAHMIWNDAAGSYNNSYQTDKRVIGKLPAAAGDSTQFTPVGNSLNYQNCSVVPPPGDTDYNYSSTVGNFDLYKAGAPAGVTAVAGVMVSSIARKDDSGTRSFSNLLKSGGTIGIGATVALSASYYVQTDVWETDPSTAAPFTAAALTTLQIGGKVTA